MPTYSYACTACEHHFDTVQKFTEPSLTDCPVCFGRLRKLFSPVGIVFKGSGFYHNDSRSAQSGSAKSESAQTSSPESSSNGKTESGSNGKSPSDSTPSASDSKPKAGSASSSSASGSATAGNS